MWIPRLVQISICETVIVIKVFIGKVTKRTLISQFVVVISIASTQIYAIEQITHHFKNRLQPKFFSKTYKKLAILKGKSFNEGV